MAIDARRIVNIDQEPPTIEEFGDGWWEVRYEDAEEFGEPVRRRVRVRRVDPPAIAATPPPVPPNGHDNGGTPPGAGPQAAPAPAAPGAGPFQDRGFMWGILAGLAALILILAILAFRNNGGGQAPVQAQPTAAVSAPAKPAALAASASASPAPSSAAPATVATTPIPVIARAGVISARTDDPSNAWMRVTLEPNGRIWQEAIKANHPAFQGEFTVPNGDDPGGAGWKRIFNGVNGNLFLGQTRIAGGANNVPVTLVKGATYTYSGGSTNGGFSL